MSQPVVVTIPHRLGREEAMRRLRSGLGQGNVNFAGLSLHDQTWSGDRLSFNAAALGQTASGQVDVADDNVRIEVRLPWLLARLAETAKALMQQHGQKLLTKR